MTITGAIAGVKAVSALIIARGRSGRIVWWAWAATDPAAVVAAPFEDYMTPKDASILLVPGRITVHSEVMSVFMASLPEWGCFVCREQPWLLKITFCKNTLKLGDRKCLPNPRRSFIANLGAFYFLRA